MMKIKWNDDEHETIFVLTYHMILNSEDNSKGQYWDHDTNGCYDKHDLSVHFLDYFDPSDVWQKSSNSLPFEVDTAYCETDHAEQRQRSQNFPTSIAVCLDRENAYDELLSQAEYKLKLSR